MYEGGLEKLRWSVSDTAEFGDYVTGPRVIAAQAKDNMKTVLEEIADGSFARRLIADQDNGGKEFKELRAKGEQHPIEETGRELSQSYQGSSRTTPTTSRAPPPADHHPPDRCRFPQVPVASGASPSDALLGKCRFCLKPAAERRPSVRRAAAVGHDDPQARGRR